MRWRVGEERVIWLDREAVSYNIEDGEAEGEREREQRDGGQRVCVSERHVVGRSEVLEKVRENRI